jgi:hypothetical protein
MVRLVAPNAAGRGQYRVDRLLERFGPDIAMPDLRHELAQCTRCHSMGGPCGVAFVDRLIHQKW